MKTSTPLTSLTTNISRLFVKLNMAPLAAIFLFATSFALQGQVISVDKVDYMPGDVVTISGYSWEPGETVSVELKETVLDPTGKVIVTKDFTCNSIGVFHGELYTVVEANLGAFFQVEATGSITGDVRTTVFNDAGGDYGIDYSAYDPDYYKREKYFVGYPIPIGRAESPLLLPGQTAATLHSETVESLLPTNLGLGQIVPFEFFIRVDAGGACLNDVITVKGEWLTETTNGGLFGFDGTLGVIAAFVDSDKDDPYLIDPDEDAMVTDIAWILNGNTIEGTFELSGMDPGDEIILEVWLVLQDDFPGSVGGNVKTRLGAAASTGLCEPGKINTGNQEVNLLQVSDFEDAVAEVDIIKEDYPDAPVIDEPVVIGEEFPYRITIHNAGPSVANTIVVTDYLDPNISYISHTITDTEGDLSWGFSQTGQDLTFASSFLNVGETVVIDLTVKVKDTYTGTISNIGFEGGGFGLLCSEGDLCNGVSVTSINTDSDLTNNEYHEPTGVTCPDIIVTAVPIDETCYESNDGSISGTITGGFINYAVDIDEIGGGGYTSSQTVSVEGGTYTFNGLSAGNYQVSVTDLLGCTAITAPVLIDQPEVLSVSAGDGVSVCSDGSPVSLTAAATGGTTPYSFKWYIGAVEVPDGETATIIVSPTEPTTYRVVVTDNNGCTAEDEVLVSLNSLPDCNISGPIEICPSASGISYSAPEVEISDPPVVLTYSWSITGDADITSPVDAQSVTIDAHAVCGGSFTLSLTVTQGDCSSTCTYDVDLVDDTPPVLTGVPDEANVDCADVPDAAIVTAADDCSGINADGVVFTEARTDGACAGTYTLIRTWTATDNCGNETTASQTINVSDNTPPVLSVPADEDVECDAVPAVGTPTATDLCDAIVDIVYDGETRVDGDCADTYTLTRTWTATDNCGNETTASQTINVSDNTPPLINCSDDIIKECGQDIPSVSELIPFASDNCDQNVEITWVRSDGVTDEYAEFPRGITTITFTATDDCGNSTSCEMTVRVIPCFYCTYTQGFYGNEGGLTCDGNTSLTLMQNAFSSVDEVVFGTTLLENYFTLYEDDIDNRSIFKMLPGSGPPAALKGPATYSDDDTWRNVPINKKEVIANNLLAQTITLWFNMQGDPALGLLTIEGRYIITAESVECGSNTPILSTQSYTEIPQSVLDYFVEVDSVFTVDRLLNLANRVLGGEVGKKELSAGDVTAAIDAINVGFDECRVLIGFSNVKPADLTEPVTEVIPGGEITTNEVTDEDVMTSIDGILEFDMELKVYPNPFAHDVFFEMTPLLNTNFKLEIYSMTGQQLEVLYDDKVIAHMQYIFKFNADNYGYSAFMVRVTTDNGVGAGRILKIR